MKIAKLTRPVVNPVLPRMERLFDRIFAMPYGIDMPDLEAAWTPALDFSEIDAAFIVRLEVPGVKKDDLDVTVEQNVLVITGRRERLEEQETEEQIWREREVGRFVRSLRLPQPVKAAEITATFADGVLTVTLPKADHALKSRVPVT